MRPTARPALTVIFALTAILAASAAGAADPGANGMRCFNGYAYTLKGDAYRYTEHHEQRWVDGRVTQWNVRYVGANGQTIATKQMTFDANRTVPSYTLKIPQDGYMEGIRHADGQWTMRRRQNENADLERKPFEIDPPMAADSGFDVLLRDHFDALTAGRTVPFHFAAAGRQAVIDLRAKQSGTTTFEGRKAVVFTAELDMFLINLFVNSLQLTYDPATKRLLEYRGIGNMHDASGKVYPVRVTYARTMPEAARRHGAPAAACSATGDR